RTEGYYTSGPVEWKDWHAGVHMQETHYHYWRFYRDGTWVCCHRYEPDFAFWQFTEGLSEADIRQAKKGQAPLIEGGLQLLTAGTYAANADLVTTVFEWRVPLYPSGEQVFRNESKFRIAGDRLVPLNENGGYELRFIDKP